MDSKIDNSSVTKITYVKVWDLPTRLFHWLNVLMVLTLVILGLMMLFRQEIGFQSTESAIALKKIHVIVGYVFVVNLFLRFILMFFANTNSHWSAIVPSKNFFIKIKQMLESLSKGKIPYYSGHNPLGQINVFVMLIVMAIIAISGLIRAGTDIYYPPFGSMVLAYVAKPGVSTENIKPYNKEGIIKKNYKVVAKYKRIVGKIHLYSSYLLILLMFFHINGVIYMERKEGTALVSAMITGIKHIKKE